MKTDEYLKELSAKMALCQAITKNHYQPCGNLARHGHETCASHKKFFHKATWIGRFLYGRDDEDVLLGYRKDTATYRLEQHVRQVLASGRFKITEEDIKAIPSTDRFTDIFLILCEQPEINPTWNRRLLMTTIFYYFSVFRHLGEGGMLTNPYLLHRKHISPILKNPHMTFGQTLKLMLKAKYIRDKTNALVHLPPGAYQIAFDSLFLDYKDDYVWYSDEFLRSALTPTEEPYFQEYFNQQILPRLKRRASQIRRARKVSQDPLKEELVAEVFHPRNVERWLNKFGWGHLDMMFG